MALGKQNRIEGKAYSAKLRLKNKAGEFLDVGEFEIATKQGNDYPVLTAAELKELTGTEGPIRDIAGDLVSVDTRIGEYEGNPVRSFKLGLRDAGKGEIYFVDVGLGSNLGKGLANSVLNLKARNDVEIGLYGQKNSQTKKVYPAVSLRQGGATETVKWKYDPKAEDAALKLPAPREYQGKLDPKTKQPKIERDWTEVEEFLIAKLKDFAAKLDDLPLRASAPARAAAPAKAESTDGNEDVPF